MISCIFFRGFPSYEKLNDLFYDWRLISFSEFMLFKFINGCLSFLSNSRYGSDFIFSLLTFLIFSLKEKILLGNFFPLWASFLSLLSI